MKINKAIAFKILYMLLSIVFMFLFGINVKELVSNEHSTKITAEKRKLALPSFNICPFTPYDPQAIKIFDNFTVEDIVRLPSVFEFLSVELQVYYGYNAE